MIYILLKMNLLFLNNNIISNANWIIAAFTNLELQIILNYKTTVKKYDVIYTILIK